MTCLQKVKASLTAAITLNEVPLLRGILLFLAITLGVVPAAHSAPQYYYFSGNTYTLDDDAGGIAAAGIRAGDPVHYTIMVDFDAAGSFTYYNGTVYTYTDAGTLDYFYADYIEGSALDAVDGGFRNGPYDVAEHNQGTQYDGPPAGGDVNVLSGNNSLIIFSPSIKPDAWTVGNVLEVRSYSYDSLGNQSLLYARVTLRGISPTEMTDFDGDGIANITDNCPYDSNADQADTDGDGYGNACDPPANPMYYTFSGDAHIYCDQNGLCDATGAIAAAGISEGDPVFYTILLDFNSPATGISLDGTVYSFLDDVYNADYFFADYIEGSAIEEVDGGTNTLGQLAEWNLGSRSNAGLLGGQIRVLSDDNILFLESSDAFPEWQIGDSFNYRNYAYNSDGVYSLLQGMLTITAISSVPPDIFGDTDGDGILDNVDNCPEVPNPNQIDTDGDGVGDVCDNCLNTPNTNQADNDGDGLGDACENCPAVFNPDQFDVDRDGSGDACDSCDFDPAKVVPGSCGCGLPDTDTDGDGIANCIDLCPDSVSVDQADSDGDGIGDTCDNCPYTANPNQADGDMDGIGDACDPRTVNRPVNPAPQDQVSDLETRIAELEVLVVAQQDQINILINALNTANLGTLYNNITELQNRTQQLSDRVKARNVLDGLVPFLKVEGTDVILEGANLNIRNGAGAEQTNGLGNLIVGYNKPGPATAGLRNGSHNVVIGNGHAYNSYGGLVAGQDNGILGPYAAVLGGLDNWVTASNGSILGGMGNRAGGARSSILSGKGNTTGVTGEEATILGGQSFAAVSEGEVGPKSSPFDDFMKLGGFENKTLIIEGVNVQIRNGTGSTSQNNGYGNLFLGYNEPNPGASVPRYGSHNIIVGEGHLYNGVASLIVGKYNSLATGNGNVVFGIWNSAAGDLSTVLGGRENQAVAPLSVVVGGNENTADGVLSTVTGGRDNRSAGELSVVVGGGHNQASSLNAVVLGGYENVASGENSVVSAGRGNEASGNSSSIAGGLNNDAGGISSSVGGGHGNRAQRENSAIPTGQYLTEGGQ